MTYSPAFLFTATLGLVACSSGATPQESESVVASTIWSLQMAVDDGEYVVGWLRQDYSCDPAECNSGHWDDYLGWAVYSQRDGGETTAWYPSEAELGVSWGTFAPNLALDAAGGHSWLLVWQVERDFNVFDSQPGLAWLVHDGTPIELDIDPGYQLRIAAREDNTAVVAFYPPLSDDIDEAPMRVLLMDSTGAILQDHTIPDFKAGLETIRNRFILRDLGDEIVLAGGTGPESAQTKDLEMAVYRGPIDGSGETTRTGHRGMIRSLSVEEDGFRLLVERDIDFGIESSLDAIYSDGSAETVLSELCGDPVYGAFLPWGGVVALEEVEDYVEYDDAAERCLIEDGVVARELPGGDPYIVADRTEDPHPNAGIWWHQIHFDSLYETDEGVWVPGSQELYFDDILGQINRFVEGGVEVVYELDLRNGEYLTERTGD